MTRVGWIAFAIILLFNDAHGACVDDEIEPIFERLKKAAAESTFVKPDDDYESLLDLAPKLFSVEPVGCPNDYARKVLLPPNDFSNSFEITFEGGQSLSLEAACKSESHRIAATKLGYALHDLKRQNSKASPTSLFMTDLIRRVTRDGNKIKIVVRAKNPSGLTTEISEDLSTIYWSNYRFNWQTQFHDEGPLTEVRRSLTQLFLAKNGLSISIADQKVEVPHVIAVDWKAEPRVSSESAALGIGLIYALDASEAPMIEDASSFNHLTNNHPTALSVEKLNFYVYTDPTSIEADGKNLRAPVTSPRYASSALRNFSLGWAIDEKASPPSLELNNRYDDSPWHPKENAAREIQVLDAIEQVKPKSFLEFARGFDKVSKSDFGSRWLREFYFTESQEGKNTGPLFHKAKPVKSVKDFETYVTSEKNGKLFVSPILASERTQVVTAAFNFKYGKISYDELLADMSKTLKDMNDDSPKISPKEADKRWKAIARANDVCDGSYAVAVYNSLMERMRAEEAATHPELKKSLDGIELYTVLKDELKSVCSGMSQTLNSQFRKVEQKIFKFQKLAPTKPGTTEHQDRVDSWLLLKREYAAAGLKWWLARRLAELMPDGKVKELAHHRRW